MSLGVRVAQRDDPWWRLPLVLMTVAGILVLTLTPTSDSWSRYAPWCILCGERVGSDVVLNLMLFAPLGAVLTRRSEPMRAVVVSTLLSLVIELLQTMVPGRDASLRDLLANSFGATIGSMCVMLLPQWRRAGPTALRRVIAMGLLPIAAVASTGWLLQPLPALDRVTFSHWSPRAYGFRPGAVTVEHVTLDGAPLPTGRLRDPVAVRADLAAARELRVQWRTLERDWPTASVYALLDDGGGWTLLIGEQRDALVIRRPRRASALRFDVPTERLPLVLSPGTSSRSLVLRDLRASPICAAVDGHTACADRVAAGGAWGLLRWSESWSPRVRRLLSTLTLVCFVLPLALLLCAVPRAAAVAVGIVSIGGVVGAALASGLQPPTAIDLLAMLLVLAIGLALSPPPTR